MLSRNPQIVGNIRKDYQIAGQQNQVCDIVNCCDLLYLIKMIKLKDYIQTVKTYLNRTRHYEQGKAKFIYMRINYLKYHQPFRTWKQFEVLELYVRWQASKLTLNEQMTMGNTQLTKIIEQDGQRQAQFLAYIVEKPEQYKHLLNKYSLAPYQDFMRKSHKKPQLKQEDNIVSERQHSQPEEQQIQSNSSVSNEKKSHLDNFNINIDDSQKKEDSSIQLSSIHTELTANYKFRKNKHGLSKIYRCKCGYKYHQRNRMTAHRMACEHRKTAKIKTRHQKNLVFKVEQHLLDNRNMFAEQEEVNDRGNIQQYVSQIIDKKLQELSLVEKKYQNPRKMAEQVYNLCEAGIKNNVIVSLTTSIQKAIQTFSGQQQISVNFVSKNLLNYIGSIDFDSLTFNFSDQLAKAHKNIQIKVDPSSKTYKNNELAYNILQRFTQLDLKFHVNILNQMTQMTVFPRKNISRYWRIVKKINGYFQNFPDLPIFRDTVLHQIKLSPVSIKEAAIKIRSIFQSQSRVLAADMWIVVTSGLRSHDLLKLHIFDQNGNGVKFCKIRERKNNNITHRYIPRSVIQICIASKALYPMTGERLKIAISRCLKQFNSAYGFKHRSLTAIITSLFQSSSFGRFHRNPQTTIRHYLNHNDERLLDLAFCLNVRFEFDEDNRRRVEERVKYVDITGKIQLFQPIQTKEDLQVTIQCQNEISERIVSSAKDGRHPIKPYLEQSGSEHLGEAYCVSSNYQTELVDRSFRNIEQLVGSMSQDISSFSQIQQAVYCDENIQKGLEKQQLFCQKISQLSQKQVHYYEFGDDDVQPIHIFKAGQSTDDPIIISKAYFNGDQKIKSSQQLILLKKLPDRKSKTIAKEKLKSWPILSSRCLKCVKCVQNNKISILDTEENGIKCSSCFYFVSSISNKEEYIEKKQERDIRCYIDYMPFDPIVCMPTKTHKNNLRISLPKFASRSTFSNNIPAKFQAKFPLLNNKTVKEIQKLQKNIDYIGLQVKQSNIKNAGKGLFSTLQIEKNSLVITYVGAVSSSFDSNLDSNSLFTYGWLHDDINSTEFLCDGCIINNGSRFINSSTSQRQANLVAHIGVALHKTIQVLFISTRRIAQNEELKFWYGNNFWKKGGKVDCSSDDKIQEQQ